MHWQIKSLKGIGKSNIILAKQQNWAHCVTDGVGVMAHEIIPIYFP